MKLRSLLFGLDIESSDDCVLVELRFDARNDAWGDGNVTDTVFVVDRNDERLIGTCSMADFCDDT